MKLLITSILALSFHAVHAQNSSLDLSASLGYDEKYVSEGRDNLDGNGLIWAGIDGTSSLGAGELVFGLWHAEADANSDIYNELNVYVGYAQSFSYFDVELAFTRLEFLSDDEFDNEISLGLSKSLTDHTTIGLDNVYSTEAEGFFFEAYASYEREVTDAWTIGATLLLGVNQGYIADEHDGLNNIQATLESSYALTESLALDAYLGYTVGLDEEPGDTLDDFFFGGASLTYSF